jgi:predicted nucleic acid-binding protein
MGPVLIDTGPIVAAINQRDQWHDWSREQLQRIQPPLLTCEAVFSESWFLLQQTDVGCRSLLNLLETGALTIGFSADGHLARIVELMRRYADVPMSVADACLVRMSEIVPSSTVLTLDSDFHIYRRERRKRIPLIIPPDPRFARQ